MWFRFFRTLAYASVGLMLLIWWSWLDGVLPCPVKYSIRVETVGSGHVDLVNAAIIVTCIGTCARQLPGGIEVRLKAVPNRNAFLTSWGGDCSDFPPGTDSCRIVLDRDKTVRVVFTATP